MHLGMYGLKGLLTMSQKDPGWCWWCISCTRECQARRRCESVTLHPSRADQMIFPQLFFTEPPQTLVTSLSAVSWDSQEDSGVGNDAGDYFSSPIPAALLWQKYSMATSTGHPCGIWAPTASACAEEAFSDDHLGANWQRKLVLHSHSRLHMNLSLLPLF